MILTGKYEHLKRLRIKLPTGTFIRPHEKHGQNIVHTLGLENCNPVATPFLTEERPEASPPLDAEKHSLYRKCVGHSIYNAIDRGDTQLPNSELGRGLAGPTEFDWRSLVRLGRYLSGTLKVGTWLPVVDSNKYQKGVILLNCASDTDHATCKQTRKSVSCKVVFADSCPLFSQVLRQSIEATSSGEAEFYGITETAQLTIAIKHLFEWLGFRVEWTVETDSSAGRAMCLREGLGKVRHLDLRILWTQRATREHGLKVKKVDGLRNPADLGTKKHDKAKFERLKLLNNICEVNECVEEVSVSAVSAAPRLGANASPTVKQAMTALLAALLAEQSEGAPVSALSSEPENIYKILFYTFVALTIGIVVGIGLTQKSKVKKVTTRSVGIQTDGTGEPLAAPAEAATADDDDGGIPAAAPAPAVPVVAHWSDPVYHTVAAGRCFHRLDCRCIAGRAIQGCFRVAAEQHGLRACQVCRP